MKHKNLKNCFWKIVFGVPECSAARPLLFFINWKDFEDASKTLDLFMFGDDTNIFYTHKNVEINDKVNISYTVNLDLEKIIQWV